MLPPARSPSRRQSWIPWVYVGGGAGGVLGGLVWSVRITGMPLMDRLIVETDRFEHSEVKRTLHQSVLLRRGLCSMAKARARTVLRL